MERWSRGVGRCVRETSCAVRALGCAVTEVWRVRCESQGGVIPCSSAPVSSATRREYDWQTEQGRNNVSCESRGIFHECRSSSCGRGWPPVVSVPLSWNKLAACKGCHGAVSTKQTVGQFCKAIRHEPAYLGQESMRDGNRIKKRTRLGPLLKSVSLY